MLHWALTAAAVLMFLIAVRTLFVSSKKEGSQNQQKLGCGFAIVAIALWVYVLHDYLGNLGPAITLGVAVILILPAIQAVANPEKARVFRAVAGLIVAILLAGPVVTRLVSEHGPDTRPKNVRAIEAKLEQARDLGEKLDARSDDLRDLIAQLMAEVNAIGTEWEDIENNEEALQKLAVIEKVRTEHAKTDLARIQLDAKIPELEAQLAAALDGDTPATPETTIDDLLQEFEDVTPLDELSIVEQHARKKELRELFESTP